MDIDLVGMRSEVEILQARLKGAPSWEQVRSIYMDLAPLIGEIQGAVATRRREVGSQVVVDEAEAALARLKLSSRKVGADIRLGSVPGLTMGLDTALAEATEAIDALERSLK
ncbi:MAG TPA: hypothetical protein DEV93_19840 [Chloroflexi bacterium]|nr:hypothetical protein [Chloroflexota bacterium]